MSEQNGHHEPGWWIEVENGRKVYGKHVDRNDNNARWVEPPAGVELLSQAAVWVEPPTEIGKVVVQQILEETRVEGARPEVEGPNPIPMPYELAQSTEPYATGWPVRRHVVDPEIIQRARENRAKQKSS